MVLKICPKKKECKQNNICYMHAVTSATLWNGENSCILSFSFQVIANIKFSKKNELQLQITKKPSTLVPTNVYQTQIKIQPGIKKCNNIQRVHLK